MQVGPVPLGGLSFSNQWGGPVALGVTDAVGDGWGGVRKDAAAWLLVIQ